jgi:uncharacterized protein YecE (DUF72 family)
MDIHIGCSGFYYEHWKNRFYPDIIPKKEWLSYYAMYFNSVELNNTFYRLPKKSAIEKWYNETPDHFKFSVKGSNYITHKKKLKDTEEHVFDFLKSIEGLKEKTDVILWQLPGNLKRNDDRLEIFLQSLSKEFKHTVEFRDSSWFVDDVYKILKRYNTSLCLISAPTKLPEPAIGTNDTCYIRFHGKRDWYRYLYTKKELTAWQLKIKKINPKHLYAYFNNDYQAQAVHNALLFSQIINDLNK